MGGSFPALYVYILIYVQKKRSEYFIKIELKVSYKTEKYISLYYGEKLYSKYLKM
jgi:hypothetical protein